MYKGVNTMVNKVRNKRNWLIFDISGNIRRKDAEKLKELCNKYIEESKLQIAVNFSDIDFIDSIGLGALIYCNTRIKDAGGKIVIMNLNENIYDLLEMTSVDKLFTIVDSEQELP